jgi:hypothetical protein
MDSHRIIRGELPDAQPADSLDRVTLSVSSNDRHGVALRDDNARTAAD